MKKIFVFLGCGILSLSVIGCGQVKPYGKSIDPQVPHVMTAELKDIPKEELKYPVVMQGKVISSHCDSGCWIEIQDELGKISVNAKLAGIIDPIKNGKVVTVQGFVIKKTNGEFSLKATGLEMK